jgi:hypothetical protein
VKAIQPTTSILSTYFRPRTRRCSICDQTDARTACGSRYCYSCWADIQEAECVSSS